MKSPSREGSLMATARWAGALNALSAVPDGFSVTVMRKLFARGDPAATAAHILGAESLFRWGLVVDLVGLLLFMASALLLYETFKPASRRLALAFLIFMVGLVFIQALAGIQGFAALALLKGVPGSTGLSPAQASVLAYLALKLYSHTFALGLFFGGCSSVVMGFLILRSTFVPRILGPFMMIDGLGYLTFSLTSFLAPLLAPALSPYVPYGTGIGELMLYLWLIVKGVNAKRWFEQAVAPERALA